MLDLQSFVVHDPFESLNESIDAVKCHLEIIRAIRVVFEVETLAHYYDAFLFDEGFIKHLQSRKQEAVVHSEVTVSDTKKKLVLDVH